jgi:uncharacterized protein (TIGR03118 family)
VYLQTNLVSDLPGMAAHTDPNLVNPWGIASSPSLAIWVADNHSGVTTMYDSSGRPLFSPISVRPAAGGTTGSPTGVVFNDTDDFKPPSDVVGLFLPAPFIFATEDGTISGWAGPPDTTTLRTVDNSALGTVYKGLAIGNNGAGNFLYAADFHNAKVDVFDGNYESATLPANFTDPTIPSGYAPFNIQNISGILYVTYALQDDAGEDDVPGPGHGYINKFDLNGNFLGRFASEGTLNSPWGLALAPAGFGEFAGDLLVGNFGDGRINAFDPATGQFRGQLRNAADNPITIEGLWGLHFGNGGNGGDRNTLYFAAGIAGPGNIEDHGLFGSIGVVPAQRQLVNISTRAFVGTGNSVAIAGFIIRADPGQGLSSKRVLLRGIGPSLSVGGTPIPGRLADTFLELHDSNGQIIGVNDNWKAVDQINIQATGLAPTDDHESAMIVRLASDTSYTAVLRGANNSTGIGLIEGYDLEQTTQTHLANISGRAQVLTGDNVLISGVIVNGAGEEQILFRAIGPSLSASGVTDALQDPILELHDGQGNLIEHNDNWMEEPDGTPNPIRTVLIAATGLAPTNSAESAILASLAPGNYTVIVRGKDSTTGVGLAEAFRLGPPPLPAQSVEKR